ncbi:MAG: DNA polymerase III subunit gamma/tau [Bacteroidetes bacterium]|nr:DNA polymerase III subunit gamma/tau [Bacteroidota bacterium]MCW5895800.1 DNA polymerase III subunit gamma/tau [Bacteroidota bacterium]
MSDYIVTARKYRPMKFDDVEAQGHVTQTLKNAIKQKRLAHAYLFAGPRGVGKTTTARLLAKLVNCRNPTADLEPDNTCDLCREITEGRSFDVLEIDGASNRGVEEIRNLRESVRYAPAKGAYKVYIIDEVHMLTKEAFNALLKTLEEPPQHVMFIFATTEIHKLPATIISRCQRFDFRRISIEEIMANLGSIAKKEGLEIDNDALLLIAKKGDGSMRDSQSIFDQIVALCGSTISKDQILQALNIVDQDFYFRVTDLIKVKNTKGGLDLVQDIMNRGYDIKEFLGGLTEHLRNILTTVTTGSTAFIEESDFYKQKYVEVAKQFTVADVLRLLKFVNSTEAAIKWSAQPRFKLEADIVQLIALNSAAEVGEVLKKIDDLSKGIPQEKKKLREDNQFPIAKASTPSIDERQSEAGCSSPQTSTTTSRFAVRQTFVRPPAQPKSENSPALETAVLASLSEGEVTSRWDEFLAEVRRQRIAVGTALESADLLGVSGSTIRVRASDFTASSITRNRELLATIIQRVFNTRGRIEVEIGQEKKASISLDPHSASTTELPPPDQLEKEHPVIKAMIRELGAEPF